MLKLERRDKLRLQSSFHGGTIHLIQFIKRAASTNFNVLKPRNKWVYTWYVLDFVDIQIYVRVSQQINPAGHSAGSVPLQARAPSVKNRAVTFLKKQN